MPDNEPVAFKFKHFHTQSVITGILKMEINVSPVPLEQSLSSDNRRSALPVQKEPPLVQLQEPFVVSFLFSQLFNKTIEHKYFAEGLYVI